MSGARTRETIALARYYFTDVERAVIKSTGKDEYRALKPKHINVLVAVTFQRDFPMSDMFKLINTRLRENHWVIVFKSLILLHILMREGSSERVTGYLVSAGMLNLSNFRDRSTNPYGQSQSRNIHAYAAYLEEKTQSFRVVKKDFVHSKDEQIDRFRALTLEQAGALIEETNLIGQQVNALLGCSFYLDDIDNLVTLQAFRLLLLDMMVLFRLLNEGVLRILSLFFEMSYSDAQKALVIYKQFAEETDKSLNFFEIGRKLKQSLGIDVPEFKHAPIQLASALEDYLRSPDFEANRAAYRAKKELRGSVPIQGLKGPGFQNVDDQTFIMKGGAAGMPSTEELTTNPKALIDFFSSIDTQLTTTQNDPLFMMGQPQGSLMLNSGPIMGINNGYAMSAVNPFQQPPPMAIEYNLQTTNPFAVNNNTLGEDQFPLNNQGLGPLQKQGFGGVGGQQLQLYDQQQTQLQLQPFNNPFSVQQSQRINSSDNNNSYNPFQQFNAFGRTQGSTPFGQTQSQQNTFTVENVFRPNTQQQQQHQITQSQSMQQSTPFNQPNHSGPFSFQQAMQSGNVNSSRSNNAFNAMSELNPFAPPNQGRLAIMPPLQPNSNSNGNTNSSLHMNSNNLFGSNTNNPGSGGQQLNPFMINQGRA